MSTTKTPAALVLSAATFAAFLVRAEDGSPDVAATEEKFSEQLAEYLLKAEGEEGKIADAVSAIFEENKGKRLPMPALLAMTAQKLNVSFEDYKATSEKVGEYVRRNAGDKESGAIFGIGKGKVGGVLRWADEVPAANATDTKGRPLPAAVQPVVRAGTGQLEVTGRGL